MPNTHFNNFDHFKQVLGVVCALHRCGFHHCDIRSPNLVLTLGNPTNPISNMSLVDMEYVHRINGQNDRFAPVKLYKTLRSVHYLDWFLGQSIRLRSDLAELMAEHAKQGNFHLVQAVAITIPPDLSHPNWTPDWFRLLDYYNLVRSFFEQDIAKWDTDSENVRGPNDFTDTRDTVTQFKQFIIATSTFLGKMMSKDPKLDDDVIKWAKDLFDTLQTLFKPVPTVTVDVVADTLVTTTKPTDDDDILPSPEGIDDSNVDGTNNLIVSPEGV
jgi:hypothetical protein